MKNNPSVQTLLEKNLLLPAGTWVEDRLVTSEDGKTHTEQVLLGGYKDIRSFIKAFTLGSETFLKAFDGNTRAQTPFVLQLLLAKKPNQSFVYLSYQEVKALCEKCKVTPWTRDQVSKNIKWLVQHKILYPGDEKGKYWINVEVMYNGRVFKELLPEGRGVPVKMEKT